MKVTYQFPLEHSSTTLMLPQSAQVLHVDVQDDITVLWALVDTEEPMEDRRFEVFQTGMGMPKHLNYQYISTFHYKGSTFHAFERL